MKSITYKGKTFNYDSAETKFDSFLKVYTHKFFKSEERVLSFMTYKPL